MAFILVAIAVVAVVLLVGALIASDSDARKNMGTTPVGSPDGGLAAAGADAGATCGDGGVGDPAHCPKPLPKAKIELAGVADGDKATVGGLVVRKFDGNNGPRKKFTIRMVTIPPDYAGGVILRSGSNKVQIYDASTAGSTVAAGTRIPVASLPKDLWVEGVNYSDSMRDVEISIDTEGGAARDDFITITVLWLDKPSVAFSGPISANNAKRDAYKNWTKASTYDLGLQEYNNNWGARMGWGSEASATVHPKSFNYPGNDLKLERDYYFRDYNDKVEKARGDYSATIPPGNDTGPAGARDDDPAPNDIIYDWDAAGLDIPNVPQNTVYRTRNNFKAFGSITIDGTPVRCSETREYIICFSQKQTAAPSGTTWQVMDPPDVAGDKRAGYGATRVTWDIK